MAATAFATILGALCALLAATPALAGGRIFPDELGALAEGDDSAIVVRKLRTRSKAAHVSQGPRDWITTYVLECHARDLDPLAVPGTAADELLSSVFARISSHQAWGQGIGSVMQDPEIQWEVDRADTGLSCASLAVVIQHRTAGHDLAAA